MALTVIEPFSIDSANTYTFGAVSATGNVTGNYILGNGALLTGVITSVANINNGTSNVTVVSSGGNVSVGVGGTGNVAVFATTGEYVSGTISATGKITAGGVTYANVDGTADQVLATYGNGQTYFKTVASGSLVIYLRSGIATIPITAGFLNIVGRTGNIPVPIPL